MKTKKISKIKLFKTDEGGRKFPIPFQPQGWFGCIVGYKENYYDCRITVFEPNIIYPGENGIVTMEFLTDEIFKIIKLGDSFDLIESHAIGKGEVINIIYEE